MLFRSGDKYKDKGQAAKDKDQAKGNEKDAEQGKNADPIVRAGAALIVEDDVNLNQNLRRALNEIDLVAMKNSFNNVPDFLKKSDGAVHLAKIIRDKLGANEGI